VEEVHTDDIFNKYNKSYSWYNDTNNNLIQTFLNHMLFSYQS